MVAQPILPNSNPQAAQIDPIQRNPTQVTQHMPHPAGRSTPPRPTRFSSGQIADGESEREGGRMDGQMDG